MAGVAATSTIRSLLAEVRAEGLEIAVDPDGMLVLRGTSVHQLFAEELIRRKADVLTALAEEEREIGWRVELLRPQVPSRGPIPVLTVRRTGYESGCCLSCGEQLEPVERYRCWCCAEAARRVIAEVDQERRRLGMDA